MKRSSRDATTSSHPLARALAMFDYVDVFCNRERLHSTLGYGSPEEFERDYLPSEA